MFDFIVNYSKKVSREKLDKKLAELVSAIEEKSFPKRGIERIGGYFVYYDSSTFYDIRCESTTTILMVRRKEIRLEGGVDEEINYIEVIDDIIKAIKERKPEQKAIKKVEEK